MEWYVSSKQSYDMCIKVTYGICCTYLCRTLKWSAVQNPFFEKNNIRKVLGLYKQNVRIIFCTSIIGDYFWTFCKNKLIQAIRWCTNRSVTEKPIPHSKLITATIMTSSNGNIFRITVPLCGHRWIPLTKGSNTDLWCFFVVSCSKLLNKHSIDREFQTPWRRRNDYNLHWSQREAPEHLRRPVYIFQQWCNAMVLVFNLCNVFPRHWLVTFKRGNIIAIYMVTLSQPR